MPGPVQVAWLTGTEELNRALVTKLAERHPELPVLTVSEFPLSGSRWIPYHPKRTFRHNLEAIRAALRSEDVVAASVILVPRVPFRHLRAIALLISARRLAVYDRNLNVRPWPAQSLRFAKAWLEWHVRPQSPAKRWARRILHPREALVPIYAKLAQVSGRLRRTRPGTDFIGAESLLSCGNCSDYSVTRWIGTAAALFASAVAATAGSSDCGGQRFA